MERFYFCVWWKDVMNHITYLVNPVNHGPTCHSDMPFFSLLPSPHLTRIRAGPRHRLYSRPVAGLHALLGPSPHTHATAAQRARPQPPLLGRSSRAWVPLLGPPPISRAQALLLLGPLPPTSIFSEPRCTSPLAEPRRETA